MSAPKRAGVVSRSLAAALRTDSGRPNRAVLRAALRASADEQTCVSVNPPGAGRGESAGGSPREQGAWASYERGNRKIPLACAPVAQWKSGGLLSRWSEVRILPGAFDAVWQS